MSRRTAPFAVALALTLVCPEVFASPYGHVSSYRSLQAAAQPAEESTTVIVETGPAPAAPAPAAPQPPQPPPPPQPYADPSAPIAEGPQPHYYGDPAAAPVAAPEAPPPLPRSRRKGLMVGGWVMFGSSYLATAFVAAIVHDACNASRPNCKNAASMTLIPVVGPFLAIPYLKTDAITPKVGMAFPALIQLAGLTMGIIGTVQFVRDGRESRYVGVDGFKLGNKLRLGLAPTNYLDGGSVTLGARF